MNRILWLLAALVAAVGIGSGALAAWVFAWRTALPESPVEFVVEAGSGLRSAARAAESAGVIAHARTVVVLGRMTGLDRRVRAGRYELAAPVSAWELLHLLTQGDVRLSAITLVEGWTLRQWRAALAAHPDLKQDSAALADAELAERLGLSGGSAEGWLFPDTYLFAPGSSDLAVMARAARAMHGHLAREWAARAEGVPLAGPYEALILASIIEKETGHPDDRGQVAGVFHNRLRIGMRLQTDPTVIYGLGERFDGDLRRRDLVADGPYNTYTRAGLPPTPIAMPGLASLRAAMNPQPTRALYFVARGDGRSEFSESLADHNRAVRKFQLGGQSGR